MPWEDAGVILISVLQFSTVFLLIWALFRYPVQPEPPINRRIALAMGLASRDTIFEMPILGQLMGFALLLAKRFPFFRDRVRQDLEACGNPNGYSVDEYLAICLASGIALGLISTVILFVGLSQFDFFLVIFMPLFGFFICLTSLRSAAEKRTKLIGRKLPYTLDLVALLLEAGSTFTEAVNTLIRDEPENDLNVELQLVQSEIEFGTTRAAALANMADRVPLDSLRSVVGAINQAEALGTPLSVILKNQSGMIRNLRSVRAEEASASASLKILIPSMLILIAVVIVVFAPLIIRYIEQGALI
ncbi:MAG: type II secretion system F family protein [Phycisphaerae bacterium]|nr:type II secretion system F family protein [Phycisphaerae bacterium]